MDEQTKSDFASALGEPYSDVIPPLTQHGALPQDGYEVFAKVFDAPNLTPAMLPAASDEQVNRLRDVARALARARVD